MKYYQFKNRDGKIMELRGDLTIEDLIRMGFDDFKLVSPEKPLAPNEWRAEDPCTFPEGTTKEEFEPHHLRPHRTQPSPCVSGCTLCKPACSHALPPL